MTDFTELKRLVETVRKTHAARLDAIVRAERGSISHIEAEEFETAFTAALDALAQKVVRLAADNRALNQLGSSLYREEKARAEAAEARASGMRAALEPFAAVGRIALKHPPENLGLYTIWDVDDDEVGATITLNDCCAASAALADPQPTAGEKK